MKLTMNVAVLLSVLLHTVNATVPLVMYSHKLVPKVQKYVNNFNHLPFPLERVVEVSQKLIEPCSSEAYVLVNQPGITLDDLQDPSIFVFLRTYMFMSSTLAVVPRAEGVPDYDKLSATIQRKCHAKEMVVNGFGEVETYIDSTKRVIRINFPELPQNPEERKEALMKADMSLKFTLRKLPSPNVSLIYTSLEPSLVNKNNERRWAKMDVFSDVTKDASRLDEFERNNNVKENEENQRYFPEKRTNLIDRSLYEGSTLIDPELIEDNELLILGIVLLTALLILYQGFCLVRWIVTLTKRQAQQPSTQKQNEDKETKKSK